MSIFEQVLSHLAGRAEKKDGDYYEGELLYCGKCNTPREMKITLGNLPEQIVGISCKCMEEEYQKEREIEKTAKRRESIEESIRDLADIGAARMPKASFEKCDGSNKEIQTRMMNYAKNFDKVYDKNIGLILFGNTGTGKTFFAECIADALIKKGRFAMLSSVNSLVDAMTANYNGNRARILKYIKNVDLLILDDLGTERDTSFMNQYVFEIIDERYASNRPVIITSNLDFNESQDIGSVDRKRIMDRLGGSCIAIEVKGASRRKTIMQDKMKDIKEILGA